jgi:hypothetical protein
MNVSRGISPFACPIAAFQILRSESKDGNVALQQKFRVSDIFRPLTLASDADGRALARAQSEPTSSARQSMTLGQQSCFRGRWFVLRRRPGAQLKMYISRTKILDCTQLAIEQRVERRNSFDLRGAHSRSARTHDTISKTYLV